VYRIIYYLKTKEEILHRIFNAHYVNNTAEPRRRLMCLSPLQLPTESVVFSYSDTEAVGLGSADSKNEALLRGQATAPRRLLLWGALKRDIEEAARNKTKTLMGARCSDLWLCQVLLRIRLNSESVPDDRCRTH
jgi:hypothetical protein